MFRAIPVTNCKSCYFSHDWSSSGIHCTKLEPNRVAFQDWERDKAKKETPSWCPLPKVEYGQEWISVADGLPKHKQDVLFIVASKGRENGRVLGGRFLQTIPEDPVFTVPGFSYNASYWMPSPESPKQ